MLHLRVTGEGERAEPSLYATPDVVSDLAARGFTIRSVAGATHNVWYDGHEQEFLDALDGWVDPV